MISIFRRGNGGIGESEFGGFCGKNSGGKGAFWLIQKAGQQAIARGCQINVVSLNTDRPLKNVLPYVMSKSDLGQMTRVGFGVGKAGGPRQRLGDWFYSHGSCPKTLEGSVAGWAWSIPE